MMTPRKTPARAADAAASTARATAQTRASARVVGWWRGLAMRERAMLALMFLAILAAVAWSAWWEPLAARRLQLQEQIPRLQAQVQELDRLAAARRALRERAPTTMATLRGQLQGNGLAAHVQLGEQDGRWELQVRDAPADALWNWLLPLLADPATPLQQLQLERTGDGNMAAARVTGTIVIVGGTVGGGR